MDSRSISPTSVTDIEPRRKPRLSVACNVCRRKKIRCDGVKPTCGKCSRLKLECTYTNVMKKRGPKQGHIDVLEQRLKKMEEFIILSKNPQTQVQPTSVPTHISIQTKQKNNDSPSMETMFHLIDLYFYHFRLFSPVVDIKGFKLKVKNDSCNKFLLYSILSVAARYSNRPEIVKYPLWISGEEYGAKARDLIPTVIDEPSIEHVQGLLILTLNEYGLARGPRCWVYSGIAVRMVYELGLHKETIFDEGPDRVISVERWLWHETRRRAFWDTFLQEKVMSSSTGRPYMMDHEDTDVLLPVYNEQITDFLQFPTLEVYQPNLDWTKLVRYSACHDAEGQLLGVQVTLIDISSIESQTLFNQVGFESRMREMFVMLGKIVKLINKAGQKPDGQYNHSYRDLNREMDGWYQRLPESLRNTEENRERFSRIPSIESQQFFMAHMFYNSMVVLLNRASLVIADMPKLIGTTQELQDEISLNKDRCLAAADRITHILKYIPTHLNVLLPYCIYLVYISATVVINSSFSVDPEECRKAEVSLNEYYNFFQGMKLYWAISEKMYFLMRDLYALHQKVMVANQMSSSDTSYATSEESRINSQDKSIPVRKIPLVDVVLTSGINWSFDSNTEQDPYNNQDSSFQPVRNQIYSSSLDNISSFDVWLQQQQTQKKS